MLLLDHGRGAKHPWQSTAECPCDRRCPAQQLAWRHLTVSRWRPHRHPGQILDRPHLFVGHELPQLPRKEPGEPLQATALIREEVGPPYRVVVEGRCQESGELLQFVRPGSAHGAGPPVQPRPPARRSARPTLMARRRCDFGRTSQQWAKGYGEFFAGAVSAAGAGRRRGRSAFSP